MSDTLEVSDTMVVGYPGGVEYPRGLENKTYVCEYMFDVVYLCIAKMAHLFCAAPERIVRELKVKVSK